MKPIKPDWPHIILCLAVLAAILMLAWGCEIAIWEIASEGVTKPL